MNYRDVKPLCEQMKDSIRKMVISNAYAVGEQMPTAYQMSSKLAINPRTIEQAYRELAQEGYLRSVPGEGYYVADEEHIENCYRQELMGKFDHLVAQLSELSVSATELTQRVADLTKGD